MDVGSIKGLVEWEGGARCKRCQVEAAEEGRGGERKRRPEDGGGEKKGGWAREVVIPQEECGIGKGEKKKRKSEPSAKLFGGQ